MPAKRHHLVPQFYLRRWADDRDQVFVVPRDGKPHLSNIINAVVESGFYTVDVATGPTDEVETRLSEIEGQLAPAIARTVDGAWPISDEDRGALANFAALQLGRGWQLRSMLNEGTDKMIKLVAQMYASHPDALKAKIAEAQGREPSDEEVAEVARFMSSGEFNVRPHRNEAVLAAFETASKLVDPLFGMTWDVAVAEPSTCGFLTSDHPAALWRMEGTAPQWQGVGIATCDEITMPLSRNCAVIMRWDDRPAGRGSLGAAGVTLLNHRTMNWGRVLVLHPDQRHMLTPPV